MKFILNNKDYNILRIKLICLNNNHINNTLPALWNMRDIYGESIEFSFKWSKMGLREYTMNFK